MSVRYISAQGFDRSTCNALSLHQYLRGYPLTARRFIRLDNNLRVYWHTLFDLCPELLKLDPPEAETLFRAFMRHAIKRGLAADWRLHLALYRWLLTSRYAESLTEEHLETVMLAAASLWCDNDRSGNLGIAIAHHQCAGLVVGWKAAAGKGSATLDVVPPGPSRWSEAGFGCGLLARPPLSLDGALAPVFRR